MDEKLKKRFLIIVVILFAFQGLFITDVYGYIDPGTGSIVIQALIGALVGVGITLKIYWYKFKELFNREGK